jgi:hypothetical protein
MTIDPAHHRWVLLVPLAACLVLQGARFAVTRSLVAGDSAWYYATARSLLLDHDLDVANEYRHFAADVSPLTGNPRIVGTPTPDVRTGRIANRFAIGTSLAILPFMAAVHLFVRGDGYGAPYELAAGVGSALYAFLGLSLLYTLGRRRVGADRALVAILTIWLATPLVYYMTIEPLMSHAVSMGLVTALLAAWMAARDTDWGPARWAVLGVLGGFAAIVRYQDAVFVTIPVIDAVATGAVWRKPARGALALLALVATFALVVSIQLFANVYYYGSPRPLGYPAPTAFHWLTPAVGTVLFSLHSGLFVFAPVTLMALVGLYALWRAEPMPGALLALALVMQVYLIGAWLSPDQGAAFGNRMLLSSTPVFALGLMQFLARHTRGGRSGVALMAGFIGLNVVVAGFYCARIIRDPYIMDARPRVSVGAPRAGLGASAMIGFALDNED